MNINKKELISAIITHLKHELNNAINSAEMARLAATDEQSTPETQYDTLGLEASYLAHGQSERAELINQQIKLYLNFPIKDFTEDDEIDVGCLVELMNSDLNKPHYYFIGPSAGGLRVDINGVNIFLITPHAPLTQKLFNKFQFDIISLPGNDKEMEITNLC